MAVDGKDPIYELLAEPWPAAELHHDNRGGVDLTYITGEQVVSRLNEVLGVTGWSFRILKHEIHTESDEAWALGELWAEIDGREVVRQQFGSQKIGRSKPTCAFVVDAERDIECGFKENDHKAWPNQPVPRVQGHQYLKGEKGEGLDIGFDLKGAATDALKKCASLIGVGLWLSVRKPAQQRGQTTVRAAAPVVRPPAAPAPRPAAPTTPTNIAERRLDQAEATPKPIPCAYVMDEAGHKCNTELAITLRKDGTERSAHELANDGAKRFGKPLCVEHYKQHLTAAVAAAKAQAELAS